MTEDFWSTEYKQQIINDLNETREALAECQHNNEKLLALAKERKQEIANLHAQVTTWENLSLAKSKQYRRLREAGERLKTVLINAKTAIETLAPDALGLDPKLGYPYRDELLTNIEQAFSVWHKETSPNGDET